MISPKANEMIAGDGAEWIGVNSTGADAGTGLYIYYRSLGNIIPSYNTHSRMTFWACADDSIMKISICGGGDCFSFTPDTPLSHMERLVRVDLTDAPIIAGVNYDLYVSVDNQRPSYTGLTYYLSVDYNQPDVFYYEWEGGNALHALPFKPTSSYNRLDLIFPDAISAWAWEQEAGAYITLDVTAPLTGELGDIVRSHSIWVLHSSSGSCIVDGVPIYEQRFLDVRVNNPGVSAYRTPGTVHCIVPFDCSINEPDDEPDDAVFQLWYYDQSISAYVVATTINTCFSSPYGKGYMIQYQGYDNTHLDLRCVPVTTTICSNSETTINRDIPDEILLEIRNGDYIPRESSIEDTTECLVSPERNPSPIRIEEPMPMPPSLVHKKAINHPNENHLIVSTTPNPFNSKVDIKIKGIEGQEDLSISIYDITGNKITTLESPKSGNIYKWNGRDAKGNSCPTGAYMYNVNYKDEKITGKILYLK